MAKRQFEHLTMVRHIGNSYGVILPKKELELIGVPKGDYVNVVVTKVSKTEQQRLKSDYIKARS